MPLNSKLMLIILSFIFAACGVKKPPIPEDSQPMVYEKYLGIEKKKQKSEKELD